MSIQWLALTVVGLGQIRPAPGTWGSTPPPVLAVALVVVLGRDALTTAELWLVNFTLIALIFLSSTACVVWGRWAERAFDRKDPSQVVADEIAGQCMVLLALPWRSAGDEHWLIQNALLAGIGFGTFRFFDILKPPPARTLQRLPAGWGILIDDLIAGLYAIIITQLATRLLIIPMFASA